MYLVLYDGSTFLSEKVKPYYGGVAEWLKAADCKSARIAYVGSNPTPSTTKTVFSRTQRI